jgi:subtilisin family serine protease
MRIIKFTSAKWSPGKKAISISAILVAFIIIGLMVGHILLSHSQNRVIIAVIDSGVDYKHPELSDILLKGNTGNVIGKDFTDSECGILDENGHGTHIAGIIQQYCHNNVKIMIAKTLNKYGKGEIKATINALKWAANSKADIILICNNTNIYNSELRDAIEYAWSNNALIISPVGNDGVEKITYPAGYLYVLGVASCDDPSISENKISVSNFSTRGREVSILAPGNNILSTTPSYASYLNKFNIPQGHGRLSGTSQAAAYVAAIAANISSDNKGISNNDLYNEIMQRSLPINHMWNQTEGFGIVSYSVPAQAKIKSLGGVIGQIIYTDGKVANDLSFIFDGKRSDISYDGIFRIENLDPRIYDYKVLKDGKIFLSDKIEIGVGCEKFLSIRLER